MGPIWKYNNQFLLLSWVYFVNQWTSREETDSMTWQRNPRLGLVANFVKKIALIKLKTADFHNVNFNSAQRNPRVGFCAAQKNPNLGLSLSRLGLLNIWGLGTGPQLWTICCDIKHFRIVSTCSPYILRTWHHKVRHYVKRGTFALGGVNKVHPLSWVVGQTEKKIEKWCFEFIFYPCFRKQIWIYYVLSPQLSGLLSFTPPDARAIFLYRNVLYNNIQFVTGCVKNSGGRGGEHNRINPKFQMVTLFKQYYLIIF